MTSTEDRPGKLVTLMDALAEHAETAPDREISEDAAAAGVDLKAEAGRIRDVLANAVLHAKKQRLHKAADMHEQNVASLDVRAARLPETPSLRKAMLDRVMRRRPEMRQTVMTLQHREFESFSDADIKSALRQLDALGLLDNDLAGDE